MDAHSGSGDGQYIEAVSSFGGKTKQTTTTTTTKKRGGGEGGGGQRDPRT